MKTYNRLFAKITAFFLAVIVLLLVPAAQMNVRAASFSDTYLTSGHTGLDIIDDSDRQAAYGFLTNYMNNLITVNNPSQAIIDRLNEV